MNGIKDAHMLQKGKPESLAGAWKERTLNGLLMIYVLELNFDDTFVKPYHLELYHKSIQEFFMIKTSQRELIMMCIVIVDSMLKVLTHTHTS